MIHVGDITLLKGSSLEPVHCLIGGSPCQDLSVAGKRAGLEGERSGLYMEQIRVVKEVRQAREAEMDMLGEETGYVDGHGNCIGRFMVWENVPGAFSSNNGLDFSAVLTEAVRVVEPNAPDVPVPKGGWPSAGVLFTATASFAWRVHDAQYWGVPQRRKRISLVCDFDGNAAPWIVFGKRLDDPVDYPKKGSKQPFYARCLAGDLFGWLGLLWVEDGFEYNYYNITEYPTVDKVAAPLWNPVTGEYTEVESKLSNIIDRNADKKYLLSAKACRGILTRAARRGKELPEELRIALENQASDDFDASDLSDSDDEEVP